MKIFGGKRNKQANQKRSIRADGQRFQLTSVSAASGLVLEEEQPKEALPPSPPPVPRGAAFLSLMNEARTGSTDATTTQTTIEEGRPVEQETAARPERMIRKPQLIRQPITYGLIDEDEGELDQRQRGIEGDRKRHTTAVSYCKKRHVQLICHWSSFDPTNRRGTWRLEHVDYRNKPDFFENGVQDHKKCSYMKQADLLNDLGKRMIRDFDHDEDELYNMKSQKQKDRDYRNGIEKKKSPPLVQVVRALGDLVVYTKGATGENDKAKKSSDENNKNSVKKDADPKKPTKSDIELARLRRKMEEQAQARAADQKRVERSSEEQSQRQRSAKGMTPVKALFGTHANSGSSRSGQAITKERTQVSKHHGEANRLQNKEDKANAEADRRKLDDRLEEKRKNNKPEKPVAKSRLTKEERKALRNIRAAQVDEATHLEEVERAEEERLLQLASDQALAGVKAGESDEEDELTNAIEEAVDDGGPRDTATQEDPTIESQKAKVSSAVSYSSGAPKSALKAASKPGTREPRKLPRPKVSFADYMAAKAAARGEMTVNQSIAPKAMKTMKEAPMKERNSKTEKSAKATKVQNSKLYKSEEFIVDSDIEDATTKAAVLPTDKLKDNQIISTTKHGSNIAQELVETITVAGKVEQDNKSVERTEVTDTTAESSNPSEHLEVTVEHTTHKRKHQENSEEEKSASDVDSADQAAPSLAKKQKISMPSSPIEEGPTDSSTPSAPSASDNRPPSPNRESDLTEAKFKPSPPPSPSAVSVTSLTSSTSSKKRKMLWFEDDGEITISPGGTKRAKRVQPSTEVLTSSTETVEDVVEMSQDAKVEGTPEQGKEKGGKSAEITGQPVAQEAESSGMQQEDEDEYRSLFGSSPATSSKDEEDGDAKEVPSNGAEEESDDFESLFGSPKSS
ncbi:hypothetical protein EJ07DRAFT_153706 [Lizonia empirigonia]|nr:hypothetical protein EJ07DRAFT_153706 [Lizonia empirigonia]